MDLYVQYTGDEAGVSLTPDGYVAYCPDGYFWLSPACRHDRSSCIPIIAAGAGRADADLFPEVCQTLGPTSIKYPKKEA